MRSTASYMLENVSLSPPIQWLNSLADYNSLTAAARCPFATAKCIYFHYEFPWREKIIIMCISNKPEWGKKCTLPFIVFRVGCLIASRWLAWHTFGLVWFTWYANMTTFTKHKHSLIHSVIKSWLFSTYIIIIYIWLVVFLCAVAAVIGSIRCVLYCVIHYWNIYLAHFFTVTFVGGGRHHRHRHRLWLLCIHYHTISLQCVLFLGQKETGGTNFLH